MEPFENLWVACKSATLQSKTHNLKASFQNAKMVPMRHHMDPKIDKNTAERLPQKRSWKFWAQLGEPRRVWWPL